jgi:hypothetical protein
MYKLRNKLEDTIVFEGNKAEFIHFMRSIAIENCDEELAITTLYEAQEYLENYCDNLDYSN